MPLVSPIPSPTSPLGPGTVMKPPIEGIASRKGELAMSSVSTIWLTRLGETFLMTICFLMVGSMKYSALLHIPMVHTQPTAGNRGQEFGSTVLESAAATILISFSQMLPPSFLSSHYALSLPKNGRPKMKQSLSKGKQHFQRSMGHRSEPLPESNTMRFSWELANISTIIRKVK
jgi:hypothetical protein